MGYFYNASYVVYERWILRECKNLSGAEFADATSALITNYMLIVVIVGTAVAAIIGAFLGKVVLKKHFKRAGIA